MEIDNFQLKDSWTSVTKFMVRMIIENVISTGGLAREGMYANNVRSYQNSDPLLMNMLHECIHVILEPNTLVV